MNARVAPVAWVLCGLLFGAVLAPPLTAWLAGSFGWRGAFVTTGLIGLAWVAAWMLAGRFAPVPAVSVARPTPWSAWGGPAARSTLLTLAALLTPASCLVVWAPSAGWSIALMSLLMLAHGFWICNFLASISDDFPATEIATVVGLSGTVGGAASFLTSLAIGPVVDRWSFTPVFLVSAVLYPLALVVLTLRPRDRSVQDAPVGLL